MALITHSNLEDFRDPEAYDAENDLGPEGAFFLELASAQGGPVLDVACGTGRLSIPIARSGIEVVGVDLCAPMLARAREKSGGLPVEYIEADCRSFDLGRRFAFALMTGHAFQGMLTEDGQWTLLRVVHRHLVADGRFAFETRNPSAASLTTHGKREPWCRYETQDGRRMDVTFTQTFDPQARIVHSVVYRRNRDTGDESASRIALRYSDDAELRPLLREAGFAIEAAYGDWDRSAMSPESPELIYLCRRRWIVEISYRLWLITSSDGHFGCGQAYLLCYIVRRCHEFYQPYK